MTGLFTFGLGYTAQALSRRIMATGGTAGGTVRDPHKAAALCTQGFAACAFADRDAVIEAAGEADAVLISTPPEADGDPVLGAYREALAPLAKRWRWLGYLSTTGVYGDHTGGWVDETTPVTPQTGRGQRRADAEAQWSRFAHETGAALHIFRLPAIYGPGRSAIEAVRGGTARRIGKEGQVFSRIHVADIASALAASIAAPKPGAIYNLSDDAPAPQHEVIAFACELLSLAPLPLVPFDEAVQSMSAMAQSFYAESKRVSNGKMKRELLPALEFPSYREGLKAILAQT